MPESVLCENTEPHMFHDVLKTIQYHCSGETDCGAKLHEPHIFVVEKVRVWCPGICDCGLGRGLHGPGEHK